MNYRKNEHVFIFYSEKLIMIKKVMIINTVHLQFSQEDVV